MKPFTFYFCVKTKESVELKKRHSIGLSRGTIQGPYSFQYGNRLPSATPPHICSFPFHFP